MAEDFKFGLDIDVQQALSNIERVDNRIDRLSNKKRDNNDIISQNDFNNVIRDIDEATSKLSEYKETVKGLNNIQGKSIGEAMKIAEAIRDVKTLERQLEGVTKKYRTFQDGARITPSTQYDSYKHTVGKERSTYRGIGQNNRTAIMKSEYSDRGRDVTQQNRSREQYTRQIKQGGYISHKDYQQALALNDKLKETRATGISNHKAEITKREDRMREIDQHVGKLKDKESKGSITADERKDMNAHIEESKQIMEELKIMEQFQRKLEHSVSALDEFTNTLETAQNIKPERGTTRGMMYERAPSIAMGMMAVTGGIIGSNISKGTSLKEGMLEDNLHIGNQTGNYDYFDIRKVAGDNGFDKRINMSETEMLQAQNAYMNNAGYQGQQDLTQSAMNTGTFARGMGVTVEQSSQTTANLAQHTNSSNANSIKGIQQAFAGALKDSGMVGQAQAQLTALNNVVESIGSSRGLSTNDVEQLVGLQALLAETGDKSMQGEAGAQFMSNIDSGLMGSQNNGLVLSMMTASNPEKYGSMNGQYRAQAELADGINGSGMHDIIKGLSSTTENEVGSEAYYNEIRSKLQNTGAFGNVNNEQGKFLVDMFTNGGFDADGKLSTEKLEEYQKLGDKELTAGSEGYASSGSAKDKSYSNAMDSVATATSDVATEFKGLVSSTLQQSGAFGTLLMATTALVGAFISASASMAGGSVLRNLASGKGKNAKRSTTTNRRSPNSPSASPTIPTPGTGSRASGDGGGKGGGGIGKWFKGKGSTGASSLGGKGLGKIPLIGSLLSIGIGGKALYDTHKADKQAGITGKEHNENMGEISGGIAGTVGGGWAGASAGASVGAGVGALFGGVGAVPGSIIGGIAGGLGGSTLGNWLGGKGGKWLGGMFGEDKQNAVSTKQDDATTQKKKEAEDKRARNIKDEKDLLDRRNSATNSYTSQSSSSSSNITEDTSSEATSSSDVSTATGTSSSKVINNAPANSSTKVGGTIEVKHSGDISSSSSSAPVNNVIEQINKTIQNSKAVLPSGNEKKII